MAPSRGLAARKLAARAAFLMILHLTSSVAVLAKPSAAAKNRRLEQVDSHVSATELGRLREEARQMFLFGFNGYMQHAWPKDELRPLSCGGHNSQGGIALTLIDALDSLVVFGEAEALQQAVLWLGDHLSLDVDARVHVFELTIRALGGLLSAYQLLTRNQELLPQGRVDQLLNLAIELGDRLLPAFQTPSGIPLSWVNLSKGVPEGEIRITCTACATTLLLEFGVLSRLSGRPVYEQYAQNAVEQVFGMRNPRTGLVGNTLDVDTRTWIRYDSSVGAGIDSMYEYLAKAFLLFGNSSYLQMFVEAYVAAMRHLRPIGSPWLGEADMRAGLPSPRAWVSSLSAFWPGMQALVGQTEDAAPLFGNWTAVWRRWQGLPELFDMAGQQRHPLQRGYPLRPELMESACLLHAATGQGRYLEAGQVMQNTLVTRTAGVCGFASIADVDTGALEDTMESFFLSESTKYLYLLHSNASSVADFLVLSTEGHMLFPIEDPASGVGPLQCMA
ncbi:hypothetical protein WJX73_010844 [Symbiochloris irregularis]|uniref:alpha-1,2-Mannosidase n=1 Tax=Symbiochloris irregularis TaxID=706552 RepID=A0AAW1NMP8_9CHLO